MKYYSYSGKKSQSRRRANKKRLIIRTSVIAAAVILSVVFALALGNHLKRKLEEAPISTEPIDELITPKDGGEGEGLDFIKNGRTAEETAALFGYLDLAGCPGAESADEFVVNLHDAGFTGVIFNAKSADGKYSFASEAAYTLARLEPSGTVASPEMIGSALGAAKEFGMRSAAYIDIAGALTAAEGDIAYALDRAVIRELCSLGFDEIVIDGAARGELTLSVAKTVWNYISFVREEFPGVDVGIVTDSQSFRDAGAASVLEVMYGFVDFFALDFTDREIYGGAALPGALEEFSREIPSYGTLVLINGSDVGTMRSGADAIKSAGVRRCAFMTPRIDAASYDEKLKPYTLEAEKVTDND